MTNSLAGSRDEDTRDGYFFVVGSSSSGIQSDIHIAKSPRFASLPGFDTPANQLSAEIALKLARSTGSAGVADDQPDSKSIRRMVLVWYSLPIVGLGEVRLDLG